MILLEYKLLKKFITGYIPGQDVDWISNSPMHSSKIENLCLVLVIKLVIILKII